MLLQMLLLSIAIQTVFFIISYKLQTDKLIDASYCAGFVILASVAFQMSYASFLLYAMVLLWALRLGFYLVKRINNIGRDSRFDNIRSNFVGYMGFWSLQAITAWVLLIPYFFFIGENKLGFLSILGALIYAVGLNIETIADMQKNRFKKKSNKWMQRGLWKYSRHPNYFGEILVWIGIFIFTLPGLTQSEALVGILSPFLITFLLLYVSGIPILEKTWQKKYGKDKMFKSYMEKTSVLIPWPPGK